MTSSPLSHIDQDLWRMTPLWISDYGTPSGGCDFPGSLRVVGLRPASCPGSAPAIVPAIVRSFTNNYPAVHARQA